jgi:cell division protease FtsH
MNDREKEIVAHHEAGHAVVNWMLPHTERVHKISIIPRGLAALGYTISMPLEDRYLMSFDELKDKMAGLMGGRASEEIFIGEVSTGAAHDFKQATDIARLMVREYGMSGSVGPVYLGDERPKAFLRSAFTPELPAYSEKTAELVDEQIRNLVNEALERARAVLHEHRDRVEALAARLLATEVIEENELAKLLGPKVTVPTALLTSPAANHPPESEEPKDESPARGSWAGPDA